MRCGVNGDPLREGKLDLPELLADPAPEEWGWARNFIAARRWQEAVTYRETAPHEYVVRKWEADEQGKFSVDQAINDSGQGGNLCTTILKLGGIKRAALDLIEQ